MFGLTSISFLSQIISACRLGRGGQSNTCLKCLFLHVFLDEFFLWRVTAAADTTHLLLNTHLPFLQGLASSWTLSSCSSALSDLHLYTLSFTFILLGLISFYSNISFFLMSTQNMKETGGIFVKNFCEEFFPINVFVQKYHAKRNLPIKY